MPPREPLEIADADDRCRVTGGEHAPSEPLADVADLTDHPRAVRWPRQTVTHGVTVQVTRCAKCEEPLLCLAPYGDYGRPAVVRALRGAPLPAKYTAALYEKPETDKAADLPVYDPGRITL